MSNEFFQPVSAMELARFAGVPTFMRLHSRTPDHPRFAEVQMSLVGVPWHGGNTNRTVGTMLSNEMSRRFGERGRRRSR